MDNNQKPKVRNYRPPAPQFFKRRDIFFTMTNKRSTNIIRLLFNFDHFVVMMLCFSTSDAFLNRQVAFLSRYQPTHNSQEEPAIKQSPYSSQLFSSSPSDSGQCLTRVPEEDEGVPIPFVDRTENSFIEAYADSIITVEGIDYTIGVPCDYCVALCYMEGENLVPVELNDDLMDDIFPVAENIVSEEFDEELVLQRTPQALTLVGELEDDDIDDDEYDDSDGDEEVEVLLSFEHREKEFNLVRLLDPVLLVGKNDSERPDLRVLLTPEESEKVMPILENVFLTYHEAGKSILP